MICEPTDNHLVFELISGYIHSIDDAMTFAQLNRGAFDAVYFNKRVRNRVLQEFLTVIVKGIMRNQYDYKALMTVKNKLVLGMSPVTRRCTYRHRKGSKKGTLCGRGFMTDKDSGDRYCSHHGSSRGCSISSSSTGGVEGMAALRKVQGHMDALEVRWEDLDTRMHAVREARAGLCKACFRE